MGSCGSKDDAAMDHANKYASGSGILHCPFGSLAYLYFIPQPHLILTCSTDHWIVLIKCKLTVTYTLAHTHVEDPPPLPYTLANIAAIFEFSIYPILVILATHAGLLISFSISSPPLENALSLHFVLP
jgi:hypothetical protein